MWWIPLAWLGGKGLHALIEWDQKQAAKYRCSYCRTDEHSIQEHMRPKLTGARKAGLVRCQIDLPFVLAAFVAGILLITHDVDHWVGGAVVGVIGWPLWAAAVLHRFRKDQHKENRW